MYFACFQATTLEVTPTVGFQVEEFSKNNISFTVYDMSGQGRYRSLWEHYYSDVQAIIYVLDSTDRIRMCVAKEELEQLLNHEEIKKIKAPILFFANKVTYSKLVYLIAVLMTDGIAHVRWQMDIAGSMTPEECVDEMHLDKIRDKAWHIT